ncbi:hypothetical protein FRC07_010171 [Ceratobasidium sp. 392]|nr:hypothetical protein FRC07_010171 [Ceratobasidium sp. 392]
MSLPPFGAFRPLCRSVPSYPICNLFTRQLSTDFPDVLQSYNFNQDVSGVGVNPQCAIPQATAGAGAGQNGGGGSGLGNIANVIACGLSIIFTIFLIARCSRRKAAVGRVELRAFLILYLFTLPFQLLDTGALLKQATTHLSVLTAIHLVSPPHPAHFIQQQPIPLIYRRVLKHPLPPSARALDQFHMLILRYAV